MQEIYDTRELHRALGIDPRPTVTVSSNGTPPCESNRESPAAQESVQSAWQHADADHEPVNKQEAETEVEESRYGIDKRQPPRKRRKMNAEIDVHTVYTTDEDDEDEVGGSSSGRREDGELLVHTVHDSGSDTGKEEAEYKTSPSKAAERRSYWLSKGVGLDLPSDD